MIAPPPVTVLACYVTPNAMTRQASGIAIVYVNTGTTTLHHVSFDVRYHTIDATVPGSVEDTGSFAPGVRIEHHFDTFEGQSFIPGSPASCTPDTAS
jgi:hypothetical protein